MKRPFLLVRETLPTWLLVAALTLTACTAKPPAPATPGQPAGSGQPPALDQPAPTAPPAPPGEPTQPPRPSEPRGWHYITTTSADMRLVSTSPDGTGFFLTTNVIGDREHDLLVSIGEQMTSSKPPSQRFTVNTPAHWRTDIVELPWGKVALEAGSDRGNEGGGVVSPDLRSVAVPAAGGLWLGDLQTGAARIITSPQPEQWPPGTGQYNPFRWAASPRWSADSKWIYFQSNRAQPTLAWWRIAVDGGPEEPVANELLDDGRVARPAPLGLSLQKRITDDGFFFRSFSPDGQWAAADKTESPTFRLYNLERPSDSITYTDAPNRYAGYGAWSADSSKVLFHARPVHDLARFIGVLDLKAGGKTTRYAFPDPLAGLPSAMGFVGNDRLLVSLRAWNATMTDGQWPDPGTQLWLLDLQSVPPVAPQQPTRLVSAQLAGEPWWKQAGHVTGGDVALVGTAPLSLHFDQPVSAAWLQENVQIEGSGASLETQEALLGLATVRIQAGQKGDDLHIRVPTFGFDLLVRRTDALAAKLEVRQDGGPWAALDPARVWPRKPLDLRLTFNRQVEEERVANQVTAALRQGWYRPEGQGYKVNPSAVRWEDGTLVLHIEEPVSLLVFSLAEVKDHDGLRVFDPMQVLRTGTPPHLVAVGKQDELIAAVPVEITAAALSPDGKQLQFARRNPARRYTEASAAPALVLDLASGQLTPGAALQAPAAPPPTSCKVEQAGYFRPNPSGDLLLYNRIEPWGAVVLLNLGTCATTDLGPGLPVGWDPQGRPLVIRWDDSKDRYMPDRNVKW